MIIDFHSHFIPDSLVRSAASGAPVHGVSMSRTGKGGLIGSGPGGEFDLPDWTSEPESLEQRLARLDALGLDAQVLSVAPRLFRYAVDAGHAVAFARQMNDDLAAWTAASGGRLLGLIHLPLQDPAASVTELERMADRPGIIGAAVGTNVAGAAWDTPALFPVLRAVQELDLILFFHPCNRPADPRMKKYHLKNLVGNPLETTLAIASLIFGGVLDRLDKPKFCFAHAGGFAVLGAGRLDAGYRAREDARQDAAALPSDYLRSLYFDSITFSEVALRHVVDVVSPSQVLLGSDYPADMGTPDPVGFVRSCALLSETDRQAILGGNLERIAGPRLRRPDAYRENPSSNRTTLQA
jgi:aminocarboxymuconate-semialdehyde decarboxylase